MVSSKLAMKRYSIPPLDFTMVRTLNCMVIHGICCFVFEKSFHYPPEDSIWIYTRNLAGTTTVICLFFAIKYLPIGVF